MGRADEAPRLSAEALYERYDRCRAEEGALGAGIAEFEQICIENQRWGLAYDLMARLLEQAGQDDRAYEAYRTGMDIGLRSRRLSRELKADLVLKVINFCVRRGWKARARGHLRDLTEFSPRHPLVSALEERIGAGDVAFVADHVSRRREVQVLLRRARDQFELGELLSARDLYRQAIELDERCTNGYIFLAQTYSRLGADYFDEGVAFFEDLVERQPGWGLALNLLGQLYNSADRAEDAYQVLDRAADLSDTSPTLDRRRKAALRVDLIAFCEARDWTERAQAQRRRLARVSPNHPLATDAADDSAQAELRVEIARAREGGDAPALVAALRSAVAREPRDRKAHVALVEAYVAAGGDLLREGIAWLAELIHAAPRWGLAWKLLAQMKGAAGDDEGAYAALKQAADLGLESERLPASVKADNLLALVDFCNRRQWYARALAQVERLLALQPDHPAGRALESLLRLQAES